MFEHQKLNFLPPIEFFMHDFESFVDGPTV